MTAAKCPFKSCQLPRRLLGLFGVFTSLLLLSQLLRHHLQPKPLLTSSPQTRVKPCGCCAGAGMGAEPVCLVALG